MKALKIVGLIVLIAVLFGGVLPTLISHKSNELPILGFGIIIVGGVLVIHYGFKKIEKIRKKSKRRVR